MYLESEWGCNHELILASGPEGKPWQPHQLRSEACNVCLNVSKLNAQTQSFHYKKWMVALLSGFSYSNTVSLWGWGGGVFHVWPWPMSCPSSHPHSHTHTFWWSLMIYYQRVVFIEERMYGVVDWNHWLPLLPLGACTANYLLVNARADRL